MLAVKGLAQDRVSTALCGRRFGWGQVFLEPDAAGREGFIESRVSAGTCWLTGTTSGSPRPTWGAFFTGDHVTFLPSRQLPTGWWEAFRPGGAAGVRGLGIPLTPFWVPLWLTFRACVLAVPLFGVGPCLEVFLDSGFFLGDDFRLGLRIQRSAWFDTRYLHCVSLCGLLEEFSTLFSRFVSVFCVELGSTADTCGA